LGYYVRVLGTSDPNIHLDELISCIAANGFETRLLLGDNGTPLDWTVIQVADANDNVFMQIERNQVADGELGEEELNQFRDEVRDCKPASAAKWLEKFFNNVKVIYAFQLLNGSMEEENFAVVEAIRKTIWNRVGGILQADREGFSNEEGHHILWQFDDKVTGPWNMAVRTMFGGWRTFTMDLGKPAHREAFFRGKAP